MSEDETGSGNRGAAPVPEDTSQTEADAGSTWQNRRVMGISAAAIAAGIAGITFYTAGGDRSAQSIAQPTWLPASDQQLHKPPIPKTEQGEVDFIVRFQESPAIEECLSTFRKDPEHARAVFQNWAKDYPALKGFRLKKTNYSGELVLTWAGDGEAPERGVIMDIRKKLQSMSSVRYADPDFSSRIEGER
ncbi:MAG: hypothetical protein AAF950_10665 [Pseudomonadota bacterium]